MSDASDRPFSTAWTVISLVLFLAVELAIGTWIGPVVVGRYVSPMFHLQVQMLMHLASFYVGGLAVGVLSPGPRLLEPAVGAFIAVLTVFLMQFFMPGFGWGFSLTKVLVGGGIGFGLALLGAWQGEGWMGNLDPNGSDGSPRGRLRSKLWADQDGLLAPRRKDRAP